MAVQDNISNRISASLVVCTVGGLDIAAGVSVDVAEDSMKDWDWGCMYGTDDWDWGWMFGIDRCASKVNE